MTWWLALNLLLQGSFQSLFLVFLFGSDRPVRDFFVYDAVFLLILGPVNLIFVSDMVARNLFNALVLYLTSRILYPACGRKETLIRVLIFEVTLVISMFVTGFLAFRLFSPAPADLMSSQPAVIASYFAGSAGLAVVLTVSLLICSRYLTISGLMSSVMISLLVNVFLSLLLWGCAYDGRAVTTFLIDYRFCAVILIVLNAFTVLSLLHQVKEAERQRAIERIRQVYEDQAEAMMQSRIRDEHEIRRLRHDLINFNERIRSQNAEKE